MRNIPFAFVKNNKVAPVGPTPITDGLVLYLDANQTASYPTTGDTWYDLTAYANNGVMSGSTNLVFTTSGSTKFFAVNTGYSSQDKFLVADNDSVDIATGITMEFWIYLPTYVGGYKTLMNKQEPTTWTSPYGRYCYRIQGYSTHEYWINGYFEGPVGTTTGVFVAASVWAQALVTWSNSDYKYRFYVNGTLISTSSPTTSTSIANSPYPLWIGASPSNSEPFAGYLSIVRLYNKALTDSEVLNNFNADKATFGL